MYAIVKTGGKQYTVKPGDVLDASRKIEGEAGDRGRPAGPFSLNDGNKVAPPAEAAVGRHGRSSTSTRGARSSWSSSSRSASAKRTKGHRQQLTKIAIVDVNGVTAEAPAAGPEGRAGSQGRAEGCRAQG